MRSRCRHSPGSTAVRPSSDRPASAGRPRLLQHRTQRLHRLDGRRHVTADDRRDIRRRPPSGRPTTNRLASAAPPTATPHAASASARRWPSRHHRRSQRYPSSTSTSTQPSHDKPAGAGRPAYRNVARSVASARRSPSRRRRRSRRSPSPTRVSGHWPLERGQRGAARGLDDDPVLVEETQRGGHRLGIGHDNRMNLVSRSPFDRRVARPLRAERRRDARDCRQFDPMPLRERARIAVGAFRFGRDHRHVASRCAPALRARHTAARRRRPRARSRRASGRPPPSRRSSSRGPATARDRRTDARTHHARRAPTARTHSPRPSSPRARRFRRPRRGSARARADALSGTTTSTGTPSSRPQYATAMPALPPDDDTKRRAPAACRASQTAPMPRSLNEPDGCSASSFSRMVLPSRRDAIGEQR